MQQPSILIVGAGAMGLVTGYHLTLGGSRVTFLVRPGRKTDFSPPKTLYCYDDNSIRSYDDYSVIESLQECRDRFDFVIVTLDGATTRSAPATQTLKEIGIHCRNHSTVILMGGVGIGLREHYLDSTGLPEHRIIGGFLGLLSHQVNAHLPTIPPTNPELLQQSEIAYRHYMKNNGFLVETRNMSAANEFKSIYDRCLISHCGKLSPAMADIVTTSAFPLLAAAEIAGWPELRKLVNNRELWRLACKAQAEIAALPQHGWQGKLAAKLMTSWVTSKIQLKLERNSLPLNYQAFNRFHHGGKVRAQDIEIMENCLRSGEAQGHKMPALERLLAQVNREQEIAVVDR